MADFTPVALGVKPPQGMTLGEMVGIAQGAQQLQQAQQLNPLQLKKAQMEVEQLQQMNPLAVQRATTEANQAKFNLDKSHLDVMGGALTGLESRARLHEKKGDAQTALKELDNTEKYLNGIGIPSMPNGPFAQAREALKNKDMAGYLAQIENMRNMQASASEKFSANLPQLGTVGGAPATYTQATGTATPLNIGSAGGYTGVGQPPVVANAGAGGNGGQANKPTGVTATQMELQYPVRRAGDIRPYAPNEAKDETYGQTYREGLSAQSLDLIPLRRNVNEVLKTARELGGNEWNQGAGKVGQIGRDISIFLGTEQGKQYKMLSKDLANVQMASMKALGMKTDADKTLNAAANGDYTYPPENLEKIAMQTQGNISNLELQTKGAQAFSRKYGDANLQKFQDLWSTNGKDSRVFDAIAINESDLSQEEKEKKIDALFKGMSAKQIDELTKRKNNLMKLSRTGEL
jgi:hypothetical protein